MPTTIDSYTDGYNEGRDAEHGVWVERFRTKYRKMYAQYKLDAGVSQQDLTAFLKLANELGAYFSIIEEERKIDVLFD